MTCYIVSNYWEAHKIYLKRSSRLLLKMIQLLQSLLFNVRLGTYSNIVHLVTKGTKCNLASRCLVYNVEHLKLGRKAGF